MADDLQQAGVQAPDPQMDASSLLRALSQGPLQTAMQDPMMQMASGLAGYGAGIQGQPNPVMAQLQQQNAQDLNQKMAAWSIVKSIQDERNEKERTTLSLARDLLKSNSPEGRATGATVIAGALKKSGIPMTPGFVESLSQPDAPTLDQRKQAYLAIWSGATDDYLENNLAVGKAHIPVLRSEAQSDAVYKMLYGKTRAQEARDEAKEALAVRKQDWQEARAEADRLQRQVTEARLERGQEQRHQDFMAQLAVATRRADIAQQQADLAQKKFDYLSTSGPEEKRLKALDHAEWVVNNLEATGRALAAKGLVLPSGASAIGPEALKVFANRKTWGGTDPDWQFWTKHLQGELIGYARSVQNDIGPRAMAAFQGAMGMAESPPDLDSILRITNGMRQAVKLNREGKDTAQLLRIRHPDGTVERVPWKRGMDIPRGFQIIEVQ